MDGRVWVNYGRSCFLFSGGGCSDNVVQVPSRAFRSGRSLIVSVNLADAAARRTFVHPLRGAGTYPAGQPFVCLRPGTGIRPSDAYFNRAYVRPTNAPPIVLTRVGTIHRIVSSTLNGSSKAASTRAPSPRFATAGLM